MKNTLQTPRIHVAYLIQFTRDHRTTVIETGGVTAITQQAFFQQNMQ